RAASSASAAPTTPPATTQAGTQKRIDAGPNIEHPAVISTSGSSMAPLPAASPAVTARADAPPRKARAATSAASAAQSNAVSSGGQVALDRGVLRGPLVGGFWRRPQLLAPPGARLAQRAALVRRDAQRPGERLATGVELGCPREDLDERALRRILRFRGNWQRARRERAEDGPQGGEDRLEGSAVTIGQAAHLSLQRGARASVHFSSATDTPSSPRST